MNAPTPGLRQLFNRSNSAQRVELIVAAGDELHVSDAVAAQLPGSFAPAKPKATEPAKPKAAAVKAPTKATTADAAKG